MYKTDKPEFLKILNDMAALKRVTLTGDAIGVWPESLARRRT
jgi:hypothetical protein